MEFAERRTRRVRENVVPLINVIFLLVIFFMLAGALRPAAPFDVELPETADAGEAPDPKARTVWLAQDGGLAFENRARSTTALVAALAQDESPVVLRADARVPARALLPLLAQLGAAGVADVEVVTVAESRRER